MVTNRLSGFLAVAQFLSKWRVDILSEQITNKSIDKVFCYEFPLNTWYVLQKTFIKIRVLRYKSIHVDIWDIYKHNEQLQRSLA